MAWRVVIDGNEMSNYSAFLQDAHGMPNAVMGHLMKGFIPTQCLCNV